MVVTMFQILTILVTVTLLWGITTYINKKRNMSWLTQKKINILGVVLLITSIIVWLTFGHSMIEFFKR